MKTVLALSVILLGIQAAAAGELIVNRIIMILKKIIAVLILQMVVSTMYASTNRKCFEISGL